MGRKTPTDLDRLMADLAELHEDIHRDDAMPADETEAQAVVGQIALQRTITNLLSNGCDPKIVELALFSNWRRLIALTAGFEDEAMDKPFDQSLAVAAKLMRSIACASNEEGPSPEMARLGGMVSTLKASYHDTARDTLSHAQVSAQSEAVNIALVRVIGLLLNQDLRVSLVQDLLLYFWLRLSTINASVDEALFQKIERNWPDVLYRFNPAFIDFLDDPDQALH